VATPNLDNAAALPASASTGAGSVSQHSLAQQIAYDRYVSAKRAKGNTLGGIIFGKMLPAASVPDQQGNGIGGTGFDQPGQY
jgi:hypothetical protein